MFLRDGLDVGVAGGQHVDGHLPGDVDAVMEVGGERDDGDLGALGQADHVLLRHHRRIWWDIQ